MIKTRSVKAMKEKDLLFRFLAMNKIDKYNINQNLKLPAL